MNSENSHYKVIESHFNKEMILPTSKSHANRALILGALKGNNFRIDHLPESSDVQNLLSCLSSIGLRIKKINDSVIFQNSFPECESLSNGNVIDLHTGDGGTTNRFLIALLARGTKTYRLFPSEKLASRPIDDLLTPLRALGVVFENSTQAAWLKLRGPAKFGASPLEIDCSKSTQFASALMLAFSNTNQTFHLNKISASETYLKLTSHLIKETAHKNYYNTPLDYSCLSYPLALAVIKGKVLIRNCHDIDPYQADSKFIDMLISSGADIKWSELGLVVTCNKKLKPFEVDGREFPDLIPTLVYLAANIKGTSTLKHLSVLRHKESDRLVELIELLKIFLVPFHFDESQDELRITGTEIKPGSYVVKPKRDHRMVMTAYLFLRTCGGGQLAEVDCIEKSFPHFLQIMQ